MVNRKQAAPINLNVARVSTKPASSTRMPQHQREGLTAYLSLLPAFLLILIFMWYPLAVAIYHSFTVWDGDNERWIGLTNYVSIFTSGQLLLLLRNNFIFLLSIPGILLITLIVSVLLFEQTVGWKFFRSVYYLPTILSAVVVGFLMKTLFDSQGAVNQVLTTLGLGSLAQPWIDSAPTAFLVLILAFYWQTLGQGVLIFLAGLSTISTDLIEAARIDGANWWQRLFHIIVPSLSSAISYFLITNIIYIFIGLFALVYSITRGGPGYETTPIDYMIYVKAFAGGSLGYASALAVILLILVLILSWMQIAFFDKVGAE
ncbi:sugar ABC transporter permease [Dictyobacter alpinus]|uniref:Sugar ABC transporter permease n=1 Tax=Dictyobacter alpinus TaxID=2014873 RepID=A0A402BE58_9CHLR|nr:sugar ABC transporter permease [Dictyobacter alpinus]GCE29673.1 sugar ABC transporter permease [Dictyobacter alpinus]